MDKHEKKQDPGGDSGERRFPKFKSTLPITTSGTDAAGPAKNELDLDLDDIQTRLPYGSEDIADK